MGAFVYFPWVAAVVLSWQDFQKRSVQAPWLGVFTLLVLLSALADCGWQQTLWRIAFNGVVLGLMYGSLPLSLSLWYRKKINPWRGWFGSGDFWMLAALAPAFDLRSYTWFVTLSLIMTLSLYGLYRLLDGRRRSIPLVSALSIAYILYTALKHWL